MSNARAQYEPVAWWYTRRLVGRSLGQRYEAPNKLPPGLLTLVGKLDALEGCKLLLTMDQPCLSPRHNTARASVDQALMLRIRERAYHIWAANGGDADQNWLRAETEILNTSAAQPRSRSKSSWRCRQGGRRRKRLRLAERNVLAPLRGSASAPCIRAITDLA